MDCGPLEVKIFLLLFILMLIGKVMYMTKKAQVVVIFFLENV